MEAALFLLLALLVYHIDSIIQARKQKHITVVMDELHEIEEHVWECETLTELAFWKNEIVLIEKKHFGTGKQNVYIAYLLDSVRLQQIVLQNKRQHLYAAN